MQFECDEPSSAGDGEPVSAAEQWEHSAKWHYSLTQDRQYPTPGNSAPNTSAIDKKSGVSGSGEKGCNKPMTTNSPGESRKWRKRAKK